MEKEKRQNWIMNTAVALVGVGVLTASGRDLPKKMSDAPTNAKIVQRGKVVNSFKDYMNMAYESGKRGDSASEVRDYKKALRIANANRVFISQDKIDEATTVLSAAEKTNTGNGSNKNSTAKKDTASKNGLSVMMTVGIYVTGLIGIFLCVAAWLEEKIHDL
jgi:hypothetical protein